MAIRSRLFSHSARLNENSALLSSKNYVIVLLDIHSDDQCLRETLKRIPNCDYNRAITVNHCLDLVKSDVMKDALLILIISKRFVSFVQQSLLRTLPKPSYIYLFDEVRYTDDVWSDQRYRGSFGCVQLLNDKIKLDIDAMRHRRDVLSSGFEFVTENSAEFLWNRFLVNILHHLKNTDTAKREIVHLMRLHSQENEHQLRSIDRFVTEYRADQVIRWYTEDNSVHFLLNRSLRDGDINEIFSWRVIIQDLHEQLRTLRSTQHENGSLTVYRGQQMDIDRLNGLRQSIGKLICMDSFVSTTRNREIALIFAGSECRDDPSRQPILFTIFIASNITEYYRCSCKSPQIFFPMKKNTYFSCDRCSAYKKFVSSMVFGMLT